MNGDKRSRKLVGDMRDAYKPQSIPKSLNGASAKTTKNNTGTKTTAANGSGRGPPKKKKKKRQGQFGDVQQPKGRMEASHADWLRDR